MTSTLIHKTIEVLSTEGEKLRGDFRFIETGTKKPALLFLHGFKGFKDWGPFPLACERFAEQQFVTISFNFSHNGVADQLMEFTELDRFANNTVSRELNEVHSMLAELVGSKLPIPESEIDLDRIGIVGHSRGAGLAILAGSLYHDVKAASAWAPVAKFDRFTPRQKEKWREEGFLQIMNIRTGQRMKMNANFIDDLENHKEKLDILQAAHKMSAAGKHIQIIAASEDLTAPPREAHEIHHAAGIQKAELHILERTGYTFGTVHPFSGTTQPFEQALALTIDFFKRSFAHLPPG